jgi:curved DNA-binding protein
MSKRDYYEVLGVSRSASADELRKAHRKLVRKFHPDVNKNNPASTERFKEAQEAYDVLSDPEKRRQYDEFGHAGPSPFGDVGPPRGGASGRRPKGRGRGMSPEDFTAGAGGPGFETIFDQIFGRGAGGPPGVDPFGGARREGAGRGGDTEHSVSLTFEQAARGTTVSLRLASASGAETIEVKVPAGVTEGQKIRVRGKGNEGHGGPGDLLLTCHVHAHPVFRREGLDIYCDVSISVYDALLGGRAIVPTLDGQVTLTIPPGTSSGSKLRIRGKGIVKGEEAGDQYAVVKILIPKRLSEEAQELARKLAEAAPVDKA